MLELSRFVAFTEMTYKSHSQYVLKLQLLKLVKSGLWSLERND
jgi:hypothetical protein